MTRATGGLSRAALAVLAAVCIAAFPAPGPSVSAQSSLAPRADADQPIEINADNLEVRQDQNLAIFSGNVDATQGRIKLQADELKVWYRPGGSEAADAGGTITRIDANGNVFVSSPEETAKGDVGVYDVPAKQITLTGAVVLTRGDNVIRGNRLVLNMANGRSEIQGGGNRVRGLFVPPPSDDKETGKE